MPPKVLKRCSLCKGFHASYLVQDPQLGTLRLCYSCWKARQTAPSAPQPPPYTPDQKPGDISGKKE